MRAYEFINESFSKGLKWHGKPSPVSSRKSAALPGVFVQRQLRNTDPYMQYRMGMAVASARAIANGDLSPDQFDQETSFAENLTQIMYAPEDEETIMLASKMMDVTPTKIADNKSHEPESTNAVSPVAKKKPNKYGV